MKEPVSDAASRVEALGELVAKAEGSIQLWLKERAALDGITSKHLGVAFRDGVGESFREYCRKIRNASSYAFASAILFWTVPGWAAQSQPKAVDPNNLNLPIRDMHLMTGSEGWVLAGEQILWTDTAGQAWTDITPALATGQLIDTVYFFDSDHGWAVLHSAPNASLPVISVAITANGGTSWSVAAFPADTFLLEGYANGGNLSFVDNTHGWLLLGEMSSSAWSRGALFVTADGGKTWSALPNPPIGGTIQFLSTSTGWVVGGALGDELYRTQDGGRTWERKIPLLPEQVRPYTVPDARGAYVTHPFYDAFGFQTPRKGLLAVLVHVAPEAMDLGHTPRGTAGTRGRSRA